MTASFTAGVASLPVTEARLFWGVAFNIALIRGCDSPSMVACLASAPRRWFSSIVRLPRLHVQCVPRHRHDCWNAMPRQMQRLDVDHSCRADLT